MGKREATYAGAQWGLIHTRVNMKAATVCRGLLSLWVLVAMHVPHAHGALMSSTNMAMLAEDTSPETSSASESPLMHMRAQMHSAVVKEIAKRDARRIFKERKEKEQEFDYKQKTEALEKAVPDYDKPETRAQIAGDVAKEVKTQMKKKEAEADKAEAKKRVEAMVKQAEGKHKSTETLVEEEKQGIKNVDKKEEMKAAMEAMKPETAEQKAQKNAKKVAEATKQALEHETNAASDAVVAKVKSPFAKEAVKEAMKGIMTKAMERVADQVGTDVANHVHFHHYYAKNGTHVESKMETPSDTKAISRAEEEKSKEEVEAKTMEAEEQKLKAEAVSGKDGPAQVLEEKSDAQKDKEKAEVAKEAVREIESAEKDPENDTAAKLTMVKTRAKVKVIGKEAKVESDKAQEKMQKGKVSELFSKKMTKHMKEVSRKNAEMVKENAEKKERIAFLEAEKVRRKASRMQNRAERQAERVERNARHDAEHNGLPQSAAKQNNKTIKPVTGTATAKPMSGPWGRVEASGGIHVHVQVEHKDKKTPHIHVSHDMDNSSREI